MKFTDNELINARLKDDTPSKTVFYDGECGLCNKSIRFIKRYDSKKIFNYVPLQFSEPQKGNEVALNTVIFIDNRKIYKESDAILQIVKYLKRPVSWLFLLRFIPRFLRDGVYRIISANRYKWFGRNDVCRF